MLIIHSLVHRTNAQLATTNSELNCHMISPIERSLITIYGYTLESIYAILSIQIVIVS